MKTLARIVCVSLACAIPIAHIGAGEPQDSGDVQIPGVYDFGKMTEEQAKRLDGGLIKVRVRLDCKTTVWISEDVGRVRIVQFRSDADVPSKQQLKEELILDGEFVFIPPSEKSVYRVPVFALNYARVVSSTSNRK